jgi:hypothetical protein
VENIEGRKSRYTVLPFKDGRGQWFPTGLFTGKKKFILKCVFVRVKTSVSDPDPHWIRNGLASWILIQERKISQN